MGQILRVCHAKFVSFERVDNQSARREFVRVIARHIFEQVVRTSVIEQNELSFFVVSQVAWKGDFNVLASTAASYTKSNHRRDGVPFGRHTSAGMLLAQEN